MAKYLIRASYTAEGVKGLLRKGGSSRKLAVEKMVKDLGGKLESFYFAFSDHDVYAIVDMPDTKSIAAMSLNINATGLATISTTILINPEEIDQASKLGVNYRKPGR